MTESKIEQTRPSHPKTFGTDETSTNNASSKTRSSGQATAETKPTEDGGTNADSDALSAAADELWTAVKGTTAKAGQAAVETGQRAKSVFDALDFDAEPRTPTGPTVEHRGVEISPTGYRSLDDLKAKQRKVGSAIGRALSGHSREKVEESTLQMIGLGRPLMLPEETVGDVVDSAQNAAQQVRRLSDFDGGEVAEDLLRAGGRELVENEGVIEDAFEIGETVLGGKGGAYGFAVEQIATGSVWGEAARRVALSMMRAGKNAPDVAKELMQNEDAVRRLVNWGDPEVIEGHLDELDVGDSYTHAMHGEIEIKAEIGIDVSGNYRVDVERTKEGFELSYIAGGSAGAGIGAQGFGEGAGADLKGNAEGKLVVEVTGENAAEVASKLASDTQGRVDALADIAEGAGEIRLMEASGKWGPSVDLELEGYGLSLEGEVGANRTTEQRRIDGRMYHGYGAEVHIESDLESKLRIQMNDGIATAVSEDGHVATDLVEQMGTTEKMLVESLPEDLVRTVNDVYGPVGGLKLNVSDKADVAVLKPADGDGPLRLEANFQGELQAGSTTMKVSHKFTVTDLAGLAEELGKSTGELYAQVSSGMISPSDLSERIAEQGGDPSKYIVRDSKVEGAQFHGDAIEFAGAGYKAGTIDRTLLGQKKVVGGEVVATDNDGIREHFQKLVQQSAEGLDTEVEERRLECYVR